MKEIKTCYNYSRARKLMDREGVAAVVATTAENIQYFTGIPLRTTNWNMQIYVLLPNDETKKMAIIIPTNRLSVLAQKGMPDAKVYVYGTFYLQGTPDPDYTTEDIDDLAELLADRHIYANVAEAFLAAVGDYGLKKEIIAVDEMRFAPAILEEVKRQYEGDIVNGYRLIRQIRLVKTPSEITKMRESARLNEQGEMMMIDMIRAGVSEINLAGAYREFAVKNGCAVGMTAVGGGPRSSLPLIEEYLYTFKENDLVRFDLCLSHDGYWSDTGRTAIVGKPDKWQSGCFEAIYKGWEKALSMVRPGVIVSDIFEETVHTVINAGISDYKRQHVGHAIGLEIYDDIVIGPNDHSVVEKDMVLNIEVPYYLLGHGGFQIEDTVHVTEDGYEFLTGNERILFEK